MYAITRTKEKKIMVKKEDGKENIDHYSYIKFT